MLNQPTNHETRRLLAAVPELRIGWLEQWERTNAPQSGASALQPPSATRFLRESRHHQENEDFYVGHTLDTVFNALYEQARLELLYGRSRKEVRSLDLIDQKAHRIVQEFSVGLPRIRQLLDTDIVTAYRETPSARSVDEVLLCFPGVLAIIQYRLAHLLYRLGVPQLARIMAEQAHKETGIDIHPGAQIGSHFFIDHGTGLVIGETTIIGEHVRLSQAVTLSAKLFRGKEENRLDHTLPRDPVIEDNVVIHAGASVLGHITVGRGSVIGGNVWLTRSVPANSIVTQSGILHETLSMDGGGI